MPGDNMPVEQDEQLDNLWSRYKETADSDVRSRLILHYSPLVKFVAGRVAVGLPHNVDQRDLVSYGMFGLIDAIEKFDLGRGFKFETYAISRIKGAIIDELRSMDWVPRSVRAKAREIERACSKLENELKRSPTEAEIAVEVGMTDRQLRDTLSQISFVGLVSVEETAGRDDSGATIRETIADTGADPMRAFEVEEMRYLLADAINRLSERERLVLTFYYYEGMTLAEIGEIIGVTESRVCQIHTKAIMQLRSKFVDAEGR